MANRAFAGLCVCFAGSGVAALVYQIAWTRQFAVVFGTSTLAVAAVLAAYMAGLALGAALVKRHLPRVRRPVRVYALLEAGIAVAAVVLIPAGLWLSQHLLLALFGGREVPPPSTWGSNTLYDLISALLILVLPTALMGATLPLLARYAVRSQQQIGPRVSLLYASNTAGAVAGALLAAIVLLPQLGLDGTIWCAAGLNLLVGGAAWALDRREPTLSEGALSEPVTDETTPGFQSVPTTQRLSSRVESIWRWWPSPTWVLPLMLVSGAVSFLYEVLWTRVLSHLLGSSIFAFGIMLASFLSGIAIGGAAGAWLARTRCQSIGALAGAQLAAAAMAAAAWFVLQHWIPAAHVPGYRMLFGFSILLPLALVIGLTYPLAVRVLADDVPGAAPASARVYSWNTVGAIVGALAGGYLVIPALRYEGALRCAIIVNCALAVVAVLLLQRPRRRAIVVVAVPALAMVLVFRPGVPVDLLQSSPLAAQSRGIPVYYRVGRSATVAVLQQDDQLLLQADGLPEAALTLKGRVPRFNGEMWMPALAVLARPDTASLLLVGYGAGRMIESTPPSVRSIDVIELEPAIIDANRSVRTRRRHDPLLDARVHVILNDARSSLALTTRRYDAIVSQPSHPWTAGASHLYTREFMQQVRAHLNGNGVFVQWLNVDFLDVDLFRSLLATFNDVFGEVRLYRPDANTLLFVASPGPLGSQRNLETVQATLDRSPRFYLQLGVGAPEDLVAALALDEDGVRALARGVPAITDDRNRLATTRVFNAHRAMSVAVLDKLLAPYDPLRQVDSFIYRVLGPRLDFGYIGRRVSVTDGNSAPGRLRAMAAALRGSPQAAYLSAIAAGVGLDADGRQLLLGEALRQFPRDDTLRFEYIYPHFTALAAGTAPAAMQQAAALLGAQPGMVLRAARAMAQQHWGQLMALDGDLAQVPTTAPWSVEAMKLRVQWRVRGLDVGPRTSLCAEAQTIIDQAVQLQRSTLPSIADADGRCAASRAGRNR